MKKYIAGLAVLAVLILGVPQAQAVTLEDLAKEVQGLKEQVSLLKNQLGGQVLGAMSSQIKLPLKSEGVFPDGCNSDVGYSSTTGMPCSGFPSGCTSNSNFSFTTGMACSSGSKLISYWYGKVNQHTDATTNKWSTDPDGKSGANIDMLTYCKKWFPNTVSVKEFMNQTLVDWHAAGNTGNYTSTKMAYSCNQTIDTDLFFPGCTSYAGYSSTTGQPCNTSGSTDPNCIAGGIYSSTTGMSCNP